MGVSRLSLVGHLRTTWARQSRTARMLASGRRSNAVTSDQRPAQLRPMLRGLTSGVDISFNAQPANCAHGGLLPRAGATSLSVGLARLRGTRHCVACQCGERQRCSGGAPAFREPQVRRNCDFLQAHDREGPLSAEKITRQAEEWTMYRELVAP
jgi:hypothetical protein